MSKLFIPFYEAQQLVLDSVPTQPIQELPLGESLGYTLRESYQSKEQQPPFDNSAMDGFAVCVEDFDTIPVSLPIIEEIPAGHVPQKKVVRGTCARIMTGAPFPEGATAVVPIEATQMSELSPQHVTFLEKPEPFAHVRYAGSDLQPHVRLIEKGTRVNPSHIGVLAGQGYPTVKVSTPPKVAIFSTGDELISIDAPQEFGKIRNSNGPALLAQVQTTGAIPFGHFHAQDNKTSILNELNQALEADIIVLSGGVSVGDYDFVKVALQELGFEQIFWKVKQRPGKPMLFGRLHGKPVFGLPGNPVSAAMCFEQYVRPAIAKMLGRTQLFRPTLEGIIASEVPKVTTLHYFTRGIATYSSKAGFSLTSSGGQGSHMYSGVLTANCIIHLPEGLEAPLVGKTVQFEWLDW